MKFIDSNVTTYIDKLCDKNLEIELREIRNFAYYNKIPVIHDDSLSFLRFQVGLIKPKHILEIGTAIGYSGILMLLNSSAHLSTIDLDEDNFKTAKSNFKKYGMEERVSQYYGDAIEVLKSSASDGQIINPEINKDRISDYGEVDFLFIDAAKAQYLEYYKACEPFLSQNCVIFCDNVLYKGIVAGMPTVRRNNTIKHKMNEFLEYIICESEYRTSLLSIGDGVLIGERICKN